MANTGTENSDGSALWEAPPAEVPHQLGKYEIIAKIGDGGMASVYCARLHADLEGPRRATKDVALKLIHPHLSREQEFIQMFLDEVRLSMAMTHRCVVQTFDAGTQGEQHFMVMELVEGCSLRHLLNLLAPKKEQMPLDIALFVAMEVCSALEYAHSFPVAGGVIHRDVSPGNVLLSLQGDVKLTDFGVAKAAGRLTVSSANLIKGKLSYMAPEQARGLVEPRSDLFALGAVLYEMVCGRTIRGEASLRSVLAGDSPVQLPSELRPEVSANLGRLTMRCLAPRCEDRPLNAAALREELAEEAFQLDLRSGGRRDMHAALRAFLTERVQRPRRSTGAQQAAPREAARLAHAVLQHVLEVPTNHGEVTASDRAPLLVKGEADTVPAPLLVKGEEDTVPAPLLVKGEADTAPAPLLVKGEADTLFVETAETTAETKAEPRRRRGEWQILTLSAAVLLAISAGVIWWALRESTPADGAAPQPWPPDAAALLPRKAGPALLSRADGRIPAKAIKAQRADASGKAIARVRASSVKTQRADAGGEAMVFGAEHVSLSGAHRVPELGTLARKGQLDVNAVPWAQVFLDGRYVGDTPVQGIAVSPGLHQVRLVNPRWKLTQQITVRIKAGERVRKIVELR